jgi:aminoglycoside 3-N-acetyltransferase
MVLLVHSSFKSLGTTDLSPLDVIGAFQDVLTEEGTLLFPTLSYTSCTRHHPYFSYHDTPSCVGILSETFRKMPGTIRSLNPIHSVSGWGKHAEAILSHHQKDTITLGPHSPFHLMLRYDARILMLGCGLRPNTFMHLVENHNQVDYRQIKHVFDVHMVDQSGKEYTKPIATPDMSDYIQRYDRVESLLNEEDLKQSMILAAPSYLICANALLEAASTELAKDPHYFVDERSR